VDEAELLALIRDVPDFPKPGVGFKDVTPLLADPVALAAVVEDLAEVGRSAGAEIVAGIEARGFVLAAPVAVALGVGFVPVRKPGKLPWQTASVAYDLEYGTDSLEVHADAFVADRRVLVVDDVLATGGTSAAACSLVETLGATVAGVAVLIELAFLGGRSRLENHPVTSLLVYEVG
jgi:adenine phosphoribosyltransferase